jgi:GTPase SAR1 family protein
MYNRPYRFEFYDTASPQNYTLLQPDFVILCYDINNRISLEDAQNDWRKQVYMHYRREDKVPVMLLGLKRDLRAVEAEGMVDPLEVGITFPSLHRTMEFPAEGQNRHTASRRRCAVIGMRNALP